MDFEILMTIRTNNFNDTNVKKKIETLWKINKLSVEEQFARGKNVACIYHSYQSNYNGDYSVSICKEGQLFKKDFDTSLYKWKKYEVDASDELGIMKAWEKIWMEEENNMIERIYDFDYELYSPDGSVSICVAIE